MTRLFALFALILMPIGMGLSPAAAATHANAAASSEADHCGEGQQRPEERKSAPAMHCGGACSFLPAEPAKPEPTVAPAAEPAASITAPPLLGTELEIATPPPKLV